MLSPRIHLDLSIALVQYVTLYSIDLRKYFTEYEISELIQKSQG